MKNPHWVRDENILVLDLYFRESYDKLSKTHKEVLRISELLNLLPIHTESKRTETFRNGGGVYMKLGNFLHLDPNDSRKGLSSIGKNDREVWTEFHNDIRRLRTIAQRITDIINDKQVHHKLYRIPDDNIDDFSVKEGETIYRLHKVKERDNRIIKAKKEQVLKKTGKLECQACGFDFYKFYGEYGKGVIESHHITPLKDIQSETRTKLSDLALLCANCHRVIHKNIDTLAIKELIKIIHENR